MTRGLPKAAVLALLLAASAVYAGDPPQEDKDLNLIPPSTETPAAAAPPVASGAPRRIFLEDTVTGSWLENDVLPAPPPPPQSRWEERALLDVREEWHVDDNLHFVYSG